MFSTPLKWNAPLEVLAVDAAEARAGVDLDGRRDEESDESQDPRDGDDDGDDDDELMKMMMMIMVMTWKDAGTKNRALDDSTRPKILEMVF